MAKQRLVETGIWQDVWFLNLSPDAKLLFIHILTSPLTKESGFFECPDTLLIPYLYPINRVLKAREEIKDKVFYDKNNSLYLMINFYKKNCKSPYMIKGALNDLQRYKNSFLVSAFIKINSHIKEFKEYTHPIPYISPIDTHPIGCNELELESESDINSDLLIPDPVIKKEEKEEIKKNRSLSQQAVDYFCEVYKKEYNEEIYAPDWGKDTKHMKDLLSVSGITLEIIKSKIDNFFIMKMDWVKGKRDLGLFKNQFNKIDIPETKKQRPPLGDA